ncbi:hypothetical protein GGX14DRAFT_567148 [Mycena pura]|uniref:Uncharacterized protein n=1 Tax=Mycena pura TaxID=153505 RepID=A0AAD6VAZ2_9AGAR|nr:hypothetical protein GGX14DRAFT_567148 [Mycena pura]
MSALATASLVEAKLHALATANLVEALLESVLYGVYCVLCITVLYLFRSRERRPAVWVSMGLVIQFFTITGHWIGTLYATLFAFGHLGGGTAAAAFYDNLSSPWISAYRMISWKILGITRAVNRLSERINGGVPLMSVVAIIAESAALHMAISIGALVTYHVGFVGRVVFKGISPVVIGISTILIYARIGLGWAHGSDADGAASNPTSISFVTPEGALELASCCDTVANISPVWRLTGSSDTGTAVISRCNETSIYV